MTQYTIFCTPSQTRKSLELGAPIDIFGSEDITRELVKTATEEGQLDEVEKELNDYNHATIIGELAYCMPTAEQMLGWLEEKGIIVILTPYYSETNTQYGFMINVQSKIIESSCVYSSRKEANLAAIDAALDLLNNKQ